MISYYIAIVTVCAVAVVLDLLVSRFSGQRIRGYATSFMVILLGCPLTFVFILPEHATLFSIILALGLGLMWWFIYLNVVQAVESSLRLRMLFEVKACGGSLTEAKLREIYNDKTLINLRVERLEEGGAIVKTDGRYSLKSSKLRKAAHFFTALKQITLGKSSQFD